jgi:hypothetical protein
MKMAFSFDSFSAMSEKNHSRKAKGRDEYNSTTAAARPEKQVKLHFGVIAGQIRVRCMGCSVALRSSASYYEPWGTERCGPVTF